MQSCAIGQRDLKRLRDRRKASPATTCKTYTAKCYPSPRLFPVSNVLGTTPLQDKKLHGFLKLLDENIRRLRFYEGQDYDQVKYIGSIVWSLLGNWSILSGALEEDLVQTMINRL